MTARRSRGTGRAGGLAALLAFLLALAPASGAQTRTVTILNADLTELEPDGAGGTVRRMTGDVRLRQDTTALRADRVVEYVERGEYELTGAVRIVSGHDTLTAPSIRYDRNTGIASATGGARVGDGETVVRAPTLRYDRRAEVSTFEGGGRILHRGAVLTAPSGTYSSARRVARLDGPVALEDSTGRLVAARGTYDARIRRADFAGAVRLRRSDARLDADSVVYFRRTERARAFGHVVLDRFGSGPPPAAAARRRTLLFGDELIYDGQAETARVRGTPDRTPLLLVLRTDSTGRVDSTLARAPRLDVEQRVVGADTLQVATAAGGVRLWEGRLAAVADSARFVRRTPARGEARDRLGLFGGVRPWVWSRGTLLVGDSLAALSTGDRLDSLRVFGGAFAGRVDSTLGRVQQIAGGQMLALFRDDADLRRLSVWPRAEVLYFKATADGLLSGADRFTADSLAFGFLGGELREIFGGPTIQGSQFGPRDAPDGVRLPGYRFTPSQAPTRRAVLGEGWEAEWLRADTLPPAGGPSGTEPEPASAPPPGGGR